MREVGRGRTEGERWSEGGKSSQEGGQEVRQDERQGVKGQGVRGERRRSRRKGEGNRRHEKSEEN